MHKCESLKISRLPLTCGLLTLLSYHLAYLLAAASGHVEWCVPYFQGCSSISAVGRQPPEELVFKGLIICGLSLMVLVWVVNHQWLKLLGETGHYRMAVITALGISGALMLLIYVLALGEYGNTYASMRRIGVNLGAGFSYLAQLLMYGVLRQIRPQVSVRLYRYWSIQVWLVLVIGIGNVICKLIIPEPVYDAYLEDSFEWILITLLGIYYLMLAQAWRINYSGKSQKIER
ncbi:hypothetical protein QP938_02660 [Porticoccaceae bacterium LTM1]|nr:hypothetical protein QP938_02660 [Porticoccaceae bacterium LTM1]